MVTNNLKIGIAVSCAVVAAGSYFMYKASNRLDPTKIDHVHDVSIVDELTTNDEITTPQEAVTIYTVTKLSTTTAKSTDIAAVTTNKTSDKAVAATAKTTTAKTTTKKTETTKRSDPQTLQKLADQVNDAAYEYNNAANALDDANNQLQRAKEELDAKQQDIDNAQAKKNFFENAEARYQQGSFAFFEYVDASDALDVLNNSEYSSATVRGDINDATSLENMKKTFDLMRKCNEIRKAEGLDELLVSDMLMAIAQSDLNKSDEILDHTKQYSIVGENLSWNYDDPFKAWYDEEKDDRGSHYLNIMNEEYKYTGFAVCTAGRSGRYDLTHGQVFGVEGVNYGSMYTVDEYENRFNDYYDKVTGKKSADEGISDEMQQAYDNAKKNVEQKQSAVNEASKAADSAWKTYEAKVNAYTSAGGIM